ncbi:hypothetical protein HY032_03515 [Candidatus Gottesmanbacteria bacterium]|nr:hypothetical protein [Candidatus Gottesmanbacteria bacterium]
MNMITTTDLRTKVPLLLQALIRGESVELIHRSKVVGEIKSKMRVPKPFNPDRFIATVSKLNLPKLTHKQMERNYREHIMKKYGKGLS